MKPETIVIAGFIGLTGVGSGAAVGYYTDTSLELEELRTSLRQADISIADLERQVREIRMMLGYSI